MNPQRGAPHPAGPGLLLGREHDLSRVTDLLHTGCWLITLRGPGGIGKTALALHLAQWVQGMYGHVQFVDLIALRDLGEVLNVTAAQLPLPANKGDPGRLIRGFAAQTRTLLILDNFEHLLPAALHLAELKTGEGTLQIVVTSRAALGLHDAYEHPVGQLALSEGVLHAASSPAVQLFVRRVQALRPSFELGASNTSDVIRMCQLLEGVPLALELAAARLRSYALPDLLMQLQGPLRGLHADFRDRLERLRSLQAAVQWSYTHSVQFPSIRDSAGYTSISRNAYLFLLPLVGLNPQTTRDLIGIRITTCWVRTTVTSSSAAPHSRAASHRQRWRRSGARPKRSTGLNPCWTRASYSASRRPTRAGRCCNPCGNSPPNTSLTIRWRRPGMTGTPVTS
jgi:hypothetical protein